jgi:small redox-active disulfide protein 2
MEIKVLGTGCPKCKTLEANAKKALDELEIKDVMVEHVTDIVDIISYGVISTPALVVDGKIKSAGRVPNVEELKKILKG